MADFLLVHGAWHGAWCWTKVREALKAQRHRAEAIDLPGGGDDPLPSEQSTLAAYTDRIVQALDAAPRPVWLVGHSLGGASISAAAEARPERLAGLIYVTAFLPEPGHSVYEASNGNAGSLLPTYATIDEVGGYASVAAAGLVPCFYAQCDKADVALARAKLRPRQALEPTFAPLTLTPERYGAVPRYYIECLRDKAITIEAQRAMVAARGVSSVATLDCDHSPFFSDPDGLTAAMIGFTQPSS